MGLGFKKPRKVLKRHPTFSPVVQGKHLATFGGYISPEGIESELHQADLSDIVQGLKEHLDGGNEELQIELGVALELSGKSEAALKELTAAEQQLPDNALAPYALARFLMETSPAAAEKAIKQEGRWSIIVSHLRETIQLDPDNIPAHYHLGNAIRKLVEEESYVDAVEVYTKYLSKDAPLGRQEEVQNFINEQDPEKQRETAFAHGKETFEQQKYAESITAFTKAAELGELRAFYHLGQVYTVTGAYGKAINAYQQATEAGLDDQELKEAYGQAMISMFCDLAPLSLGLHRLEQKQDKRTSTIGREVFANIQKTLPHQGAISTAVFSPDGKTLVSGASDGYVKFWDIDQGIISDNLLLEPLPPIVKLRYSSDMQFIAVVTIIERAAGNQHKIDVYDLATKALVNSYANEAETYLDFLFKGDEIILSVYDYNKRTFLLKQWDFKNNQVAEKDSLVIAFSFEKIPGVIKFPDVNDGHFLLTSMFDRSSRALSRIDRNPFQLVHVKQGYFVSRIDRDLGAKEMILFSEDKKMAAIINERLPPKLLNITSGTAQELTNLKGKVNAVCFSPDNKFILAIIADKDIVLWSIKETPTQQWKKTTSSVSSMAFSPDGQFIILGLRDASIMLIDVKDGNQLRRFPFVGFPGWQPLKRKEIHGSR